MNNQEAYEIINTLASGVDPLTGEIFPEESTLQQPDVVRALFKAAIALQSPGKSSRNLDRPDNAGVAWNQDEENELLAAFDAGKSIKEIAAIHQRSTGAIRSRLVKLGRLERAVERSKGGD